MDKVPRTRERTANTTEAPRKRMLRETPDLGRARARYEEARATARKAWDVFQVCSRLATLALAEWSALVYPAAGQIVRKRTKS